MKHEKILVVDDDKTILYAFQQVFQNDGFQTVTARTGEEAIATIAQEHPKVIFMDISMPGMDGLQTLQKLKDQALATPIIIITGYGTMETAIKAVQAGAFEYLTKPLDLTKIREVTHKALKSIADSDRRTDRPTAFKIDALDRYELIGKSNEMQEIYKLIGSVSTTPNFTPVLVLGESGTGKELVAREIHAHATDPGQPFVAVNCAAFPESLLESELFGYEKGTFTGADDRKLGKFEIAGAGTIFLDEIGSLSLQLQQKLLRVVQEREFERLGGNNSIPVNARFIAATNEDIVADIADGRFREDLYFRLNVVAIHLPPLRDRAEDIPLLAHHFLSKYNENLGRSVAAISPDAMEILTGYRFPGNVRELENLIERAVMLTKGDVILPDVFGDLGGASTSRRTPIPVISDDFAVARTHVMNLFERQFLLRSLATHRGNVTNAAKASGMTRQNFQRLLKKHNIKATTFRQ